MDSCIQKWLMRFLRSMLGVRTSTPSWGVLQPVHAYIILSPIAIALYFARFFIQTSPSAPGIPPAGHPICCLP
eukprot:141738-Pelagomonas_calceolata.AAC.1